MKALLRPLLQNGLSIGKWPTKLTPKRLVDTHGISGWSCRRLYRGDLCINSVRKPLFIHYLFVSCEVLVVTGVDRFQVERLVAVDYFLNLFILLYDLFRQQLQALSSRLLALRTVH